MEKNENKFMYIIAFVIFLFFVLIAFLFVKYELGKYDKESKVENSSEEDSEKSVFRSCYGSYTGELNSKKEFYTLKLNKDDSFVLYRDDVTEKGYYVIVGNSLMLLSMKHTSGPVDKDPAYTSLGSFVISEDCKSIYTTGFGMTSNQELTFNRE